MESNTIVALAIFFLLPVIVITLYIIGVLLLGTAIFCLFLFVIVFIIVPVIYKNSYSFQRNLLFLNFVTMPTNFKNPKAAGLSGARNFYITTDDNVTLGVWQILPSSRLSPIGLEVYTEKDFENALASGLPIFIYLHGNSGNRGSGHRVELYKKLQKCNYNVIAFDYRSYGDSSNVDPSEEGVVSDSKAVYKWIKSHSKKSKIFLWGHSLGTGISSHLLDDLESEGAEIAGLVLEAPFNNMADEVRSYPMTKLFRHLPWFDYFFTEPMYENGFKFESDKHLLRVKAPILILHAEDDLVIPISLGHKLYNKVKEARSGRSPTTFLKFDKSNHFGHKFIYKDAELDKKVMKFVDDSLSFKPF